MIRFVAPAAALIASVTYIFSPALAQNMGSRSCDAVSRAAKITFSDDLSVSIGENRGLMQCDFRVESISLDFDTASAAFIQNVIKQRNALKEQMEASNIDPMMVERLSEEWFQTATDHQNSTMSSAGLDGRAAADSSPSIWDDGQSQINVLRLETDATVQSLEKLILENAKTLALADVTNKFREIEKPLLHTCVSDAIQGSLVPPLLRNSTSPETGLACHFVDEGKRFAISLETSNQHLSVLLPIAETFHEREE